MIILANTPFRSNWIAVVPGSLSQQGCAPWLIWAACTGMLSNGISTQVWLCELFKKLPCRWLHYLANQYNGGPWLTSAFTTLILAEMLFTIKYNKRSATRDNVGKKINKYLSDIKVAFQVISNDAVEFICREERGFAGLDGDLKNRIHLKGHW